MKQKTGSIWIIGICMILIFFGCADLSVRGRLTSGYLTRLVKKIQPSVVTVITYDINGRAADLGSGFFIDKKGHLITNYHVLKGAYGADVKTYTGEKYPIELIVAENEDADLIQARVAIPEEAVQQVMLTEAEPSIGERVLVVGSPLGLEQTVSEGIVSAVRDLPVVGKVFQLSAPISPGSSGSPVVNMTGNVVGVVSFQATLGQNINFAVASKGVLNLKLKIEPQTISEWTYDINRESPKMAEELCKKGFSFSIRGEFKEALTYYKEATEKSPEDSTAWYGLGSCYDGLDKPEAAITAFQQAIKAEPHNVNAYYNLGYYYAKLGRYEDAIATYKQAVAVDPDHAPSYFDMGLLYGKLDEFEAGEMALKEVLRISPNHAPSYYYIGIGKTKLGQNEAAIQAYRKALEIDPESLQTLYQLGVAYGNIGNFEGEIASYKAAIRVDPDFAPAHYKMGIIYLKNGNKAAALDEYKILKGLHPELADMLFNRIYW